ncbi:MAG: hypothetical protein DRR16_01465 [Candidatus Parabeggiatoa sp. nov. 3]|nr:MAG: hypothetical protein DRR00_10980 [Gammaproteobacteria bacterium]RKZ65084.1 MAG: hypothetical protein DRQ99_13685 [Gammaproteobacteria bacterium]RKZ89856.1 MAG: hypothetical protein DRR16_01465 [Gammaproteobacteria bacterium]
MTDIEESMLSILRDFGGESSAFLMTNADGPWGKLGDSDTLKATMKSLQDQGAVTYDADNDVVKVA